MKQRTRGANRLPTVIVGIPAYNEVSNIGRMIALLLRQRTGGFSMVEIIVVSDGSDDGTDDVVRDIAKDEPRLSLIADGKRMGKPARMNMIMDRSKSDILVIMDADIVLENDDVLRELVRPLLVEANLAHVSGHSLPIRPVTAVEKIAFAGAMVWERARGSKEASKLYFSDGRIRAFRRTMYSGMRFPNASADEAFSFLYGESNSFRFAVAKKALVRYALPSTFTDYMLQMRRFLRSKYVQDSNFDRSFVASFYTIGSWIKFRALISIFWSDPFWMALYVLSIPLSRISHWTDRASETGTWRMIRSTKKLRVW